MKCVCWWYSIAAEIAVLMEDLRRGVAQHMRENERQYGSLRYFDKFGGYQLYCDRVGTCGIYVEGTAELAATADYIGRHILIMGADETRDVYLFADGEADCEAGGHLLASDTECKWAYVGQYYGVRDLPRVDTAF